MLCDCMECEFVCFFVCDFEFLFDEVFGVFGEFVGVDFVDFVFVFNLILGVNVVFCLLDFVLGDELFVMDYGYNVCNNIFVYVVVCVGVWVVLVFVFFFVCDEFDVVDVVFLCVIDCMCFVLVDYVMSFMGLVFFVVCIVVVFVECGIDVMVDGVYVFGMFLVDICVIGVVYYVGICYKWVCVFKGVLFFYV